jgi:competence transcription factor ComK
MNRNENSTESSRRYPDVSMQLVIDRLSLLHEDVGELRDDTKTSMREMANAVTKLVLIEERQTQMNESYRSFNNQLEKADIRTTALESRIDTLEKEQPMTKQVVTWVIYAVTAIVAASSTYLLKALGFM